MTKSLVSLHLQLSVACGPSTGTDRTAQGSEGAVRDIAKDIHFVTGDIDGDDEVSYVITEVILFGNEVLLLFTCTEVGFAYLRHLQASFTLVYASCTCVDIYGVTSTST